MPPLSPSDLHFPSHPPGTITLAGRVTEVQSLEVTLADAFTSVRVALSGPVELSPGDLVVLRVIFQDGHLTSGHLLSRMEPARPPTTIQKRMDELPASETDRLIHRGTGKALLARARGIRSVREFFGGRGFLEVDTPAMVPSPGLDLHLDAFEVLSDKPDSGYPSFLITSPEYQMKRLLSGGVPRCFQISHCFRRGELGARHNPEFLMLEWYRSFATMEDVVSDTEDLVRAIAVVLSGGAAIEWGGIRVDLSGPFERLSVAEAFHRYAGVDPEAAIGMASEDEEQFFRILVDQVEPALSHVRYPVFLVDYPAPMASLARKKPDDPRVAERFELYIAGVELCNGFGELTDPVEQRDRFVQDQAQRRAAGKPVYPIDERFLSALLEGMPPAAGNALGLDRLIALCLGESNIAAVQSFPWGWL